MAAQGLWTLLLVGACACAVPGTGRASQSTAAPEPAVRTTIAVTPRSYQPKPKETLDQVIEHTLPGSPLKIELLRQAFMSQNPQAFVPGKVPRLRKGVPLTVPDHEELVRIHLGVRAAPVVEPAQAPRFTPSTVEERKHWVQFP
jgi:Tfp pilus assembly protein FimV